MFRAEDGRKCQTGHLCRSVFIQNVYGTSAMAVHSGLTGQHPHAQLATVFLLKYSKPGKVFLFQNVNASFY
jgi:hypothetical protein